MMKVAVEQVDSGSRGRHPVVMYLARLCVTGVLVAVAFRQANPARVLAVLAGVDLGRFVLSMVAFAGAQVLFAKRTQMLLLLQNMPATVRNVFGMNLASAFYTLVLPTSLAGGVVRWHRMSSVDGERAQAFSVLLLERILDNYSWLLLLCAATVSLSLRGVVPLALAVATSLLFGATAIAGYGVLVMVRSGRLSNPLDVEAIRFVPRGVSARIGNVLWAVRNSVVPARELEKLALLSLALNAGFQVIIYNVLVAFVPEMAFDQFLFVSMPATILVQLPITIAGIGLNETLFGRILPLLGMSSASALSVGVAGSSVNVLWSLIGGACELAGLGGFRKRPPIALEA